MPKQTPTINIIEQAAHVDRIVNERYYEVLLNAFQTEAITQGFQFIEGEVNCNISLEEKDALGKAVLLARTMSVWPRLSNDAHHNYAVGRTEDGEAENWTDALLAALSIRGIVLSRNPIPG